MIINDIISYLQERIPLQEAEDFDNVGLLCGNINRECTGVLICHDALERVVDEAIEVGANLILTFHPIIFSGLKSITGRNYVECAVVKAMENKIAIYATHTAFDNHYFGVNYGICEALKLKNQKVLMPKQKQLSRIDVYVPKTHAEEVKEAMFKAGAGNIGFYSECSFSVEGNGTFKPEEGANPFLGTVSEREMTEETLISFISEDYKVSKIISAMKQAHPYEEVAYQIIATQNENHFSGLGRYGELENAMDEIEFLNYVKNTFGISIIRHSNLMGKPIKTVGVLGGSGASGIKAAIGAKCDAYLTGDVKYHDFFAAEGQMLLCDIGHFESEQFVSQQIFEILSEKFPKFAFSISKEKTNPVNYFL